MAETLVVYTVALGTEYTLPDVAPEGGVDHICFTNASDLDPNGWELRQVAPLLPMDITRSSREQKIRPHRWLGAYDRSLYIDTTVQLSGNPQALWDMLVPDETVLFGGLEHSFCDSIGREFEVVAQKGLEDTRVLRQQRAAYAQMAPELLARKPVWGGLLARRHNDPALQDAMEIWFANVLRYGRRDQLSLVLALSALEPGQCHVGQGDIGQSDHHRWPVRGGSPRSDRFYNEIHGGQAGARQLWGKISRGVRRRLGQL